MFFFGALQSRAGLFWARRAGAPRVLLLVTVRRVRTGAVVWARVCTDTGAHLDRFIASTPLYRSRIDLLPAS